MIGKWEYIAEELRKGKMEELALMADKIEEHLKEIYGDTVTEAFAYDFLHDSIHVEISKVVEDGSYCVGCEETANKYGGTIYIGTTRCSMCEYGKKYGMCIHDDSEYVSIWTAIKGEK